MPLVDLKTNLKSLKYGRDRLNGGSSGEPFVTKDIVGPFSGLHRTGGSDLLIRGGFLLGDRITDDVVRLGKYFASTEGVLWATTQNVLSETGVRIYGGYPTLTQTANSFRLNDGTYLPSSTLLQLAANPFGGHLNKQGTDPTGLTLAGRPEYLKLQRDLKIVNFGLSGDKEANRLLNLKKEHIDQVNLSPNLYTYLGGPGAGTRAGGAGKTVIRFADQRTGINASQTSSRGFFRGKPYTTESNLVEITKFGVSPQYGLKPVQNLISDIDGLRFDVKSATDKFYTEKRDTTINRNSILNLPNEAPLNSDGTLNPNFDPTSVKDIPTIEREYINKDFQKRNQIIGNPDTDTSIDNSINANFTGLDRTPTVIQDFRATKKNRVKSPDYTSNKKLETRVLLGNPGDPSLKRIDYVVGPTNERGKPSTVGQDKINNLFIYKSSAVTPSLEKKNDLVKFRIATIDLDEPDQKVFTHFRAFINGMSDSFSSQWDSFKYMGRGENFYNYQGFDRSMRLNWTVMAQSKNELATQYQKLNYLASTLAPNYSDAGFMRGNIHQLTIGGYVYEYPGIIESLDFTIPEDSPWEIGITSGQESFDKTVKELPHRIEVAMSFKPISKFLPQTQKNISGTGVVDERFLSLETGEGGAAGNLYEQVGSKKSIKA